MAIPLALSSPGAEAAPSAGAGVAASWHLQYRSASPNTRIVAVVAPGRGDAWVFGDTWNGALALHWAGGRWHSESLPGGTRFSPAEAEASSATDIWVVGEVFAKVNGVVTQTGTKILRYNGHGWTSVPVPGPNGTGGLAVVSSSNVWGQAGTTGCTPRCFTGLLHWNGTTWQPRQVPIPFAELAATSGGQVWAIGQARLDKNGHPAGPWVAYTWTGTSWRYVQGIPDRSGLGKCGCGTGVTANNDVWIANAHWNGKSWHLLRSAFGQPVGGNTVPDGRRGAWFGPWAHWTGHIWIDTLNPVYMPAFLWQHYDSWNLFTIARVPGTTTILAAGGITNGRTNRTYGAVLSFGRMP
jgi:hypothetical protein